ncbi:MAG: lamin tail domain-containing protein [Planctomycetes bacterium]|nr:lamin tail domain-containing protein [Planctomycetota bacterium]
MNKTERLAIAAFLINAIAPTVLPAQQVVLSEIRADTAERWVEIHNRGPAVVDLSNWTLHYSTHTQFLPQGYWWPFPSGTTLQPGGYLRVFWHQNPTGSAAPGEYFTGTSPYGYLFGLGGETLHGSAGAFGLVDSQLNAQMIVPARYVDWVSWGDHDFQREQLAVQNGTWTSGVHAPAIPFGHSCARHLASIGVVSTHEQQWFLDATPTPMGPNTSGMAVTSYGQSCTVPGHHLLGDPVLQTTSLPLLGNARFGYSVSNTTGFYGETMLLAFATRAAPSGQRSLLPYFPGATCVEAIDTDALIGSVLMSTHVVQTEVPLSLANLPPAIAGLELHSEALVFDWLPNAYLPFLGISNGLSVVIGS